MSAAVASDIKHALSGSAEDYINDPSIEAAWAVKAFEAARLHMHIVNSVNSKYLQLSEVDDLIYETFRKMFPDFNVETVDEEAMKSERSKPLWREFADNFKSLEDYNFGTLLRIRVNGEYDSDNTILVPRIHFLAVEIARNREGYNNRKRVAEDGVKTT